MRMPLAIFLSLMAVGVLSEFCSAGAASERSITSLSEELERAESGAVIVVSGPREFKGPIVIKKPVTLVGTNNPVIDGGGSGSAVTIYASNVVLRGFTVQNAGHDLNTLDSAIMLFGHGAEVSDCSVRSGGFGVFVRGATNCTIVNNTIIGDTALHPSSRGNGIQLWKTKHNRVRNNRICDVRDGIYFSFADRNEITGNEIERTRFAIHYMYSHYNRLLTNTLSGNAVGATLMFSQYSLVQGNRAYANTRHGMLFKQLDNSEVIGNFIHGQNRGLFIQQAAMSRFENNIIATNDIGVYLSNGSEQNVFVGNIFLNNVDQIWQPPFDKDLGPRGPNTFYENGRGNYWSDYAGADATGDGIGDTPYHETDVYGYLVDRYSEARVFALSPAVSLLRKSEELLPVMNLPGVMDLFPLMRPNQGIR